MVLARILERSLATPSRSGLGEDSEGTRGRTAIVCAGERCGHARPPAPRIRYSNGSRSMVRLPHYSQGTRRALAGYLRARAWNDTGRGSGRGRAGHSQRRRAEHKGVLPTIPSTPRRCATAGGLLPAYSRPDAARVRARQCDGACGRTQGCLRTPTGRRLHARARRGIARTAGAQISQQLERRQRGGDRAVQRVQLERPATCMVRPAVQGNAHAPVRAAHSHEHSTRWPHGSSPERVLDTGTRRGC
jgi:hypothetical protein